MSNECMSLPPLVDNDPVEDVMERVCEKCRFPFLCSNEDELERECDACGIERAIRMLLGGNGNAKEKEQFYERTDKDMEADEAYVRLLDIANSANRLG